ncbi:MAG: hypothetical protein LBT36_04260, partial [Oscillospiraceae bacterium]|nr:hypothetical protein [Oscillospiraceae bacterium]
MKRIANRLARLTILPLLLCAVALSGCERFTPPEPDRFPLTAEQKLADFEQFYDTLLTSYPNFDDAAALFGVDFRARHDYYQRLVEGAETDFSYFCVLNAIEEDVPSFHTDMMLPFYEDIRDLGGYNLRAVLARRDLRESMDYWYDCLEEGCEELADVGFMSFKYIDGGYLYDPLYSEPAYDTYGGYSVTAVDGADITDYAVSNVSCDELKYDYPRGTPYRYFVTFNDAVGTPVTLTLEDPQGNTETLTLFASIEAETVSYYAYLFYDYGDEDDDKRDDGEDSDDWDDSVYSYVDEARGVTFVAVCDLDNEEGETLAAILTEAVARGGDLIIDLRSNGGGYTSYTAEYIYAPLYGETFTREYSWYMP